MSGRYEAVRLSYAVLEEELLACPLANDTRMIGEGKEWSICQGKVNRI